MAFSCTASGIQISVSEKALVINGLSSTSTGNETELIQPLLFVTVSVTVLVPEVE